jgi:hypothetical protein
MAGECRDIKELLVVPPEKFKVAAKLEWQI